MACLNSDGSLTVLAGALIRSLADASDPAALASATGLPLYRVRAGLRELSEAGLASADGPAYTLTARGQALLASVSR
jgi:DNA-binding IclR family transcriptional regulator